MDTPSLPNKNQPEIFFRKPVASDVKQVEKKPNRPKDFKEFYYHEDNFVIEPDFVEYIKLVENNVKKGFKNGVWIPYNDLGHLAVGYGHRLVGDEKVKYARGAPDSVVQQFLLKDIKSASEKAQTEVDARFGFGTYAKLPNIRKEMLVDFVYNIGTLRSFPKFTRAVVVNDLATMRKEYQRSAGGKPLKGRNDAFYNRYLK